jgi:hypothetical protein
VAAAPAGALVGKIGNGAAFVIGSQNRVQMIAAGQLFLGVNDGHLQDNEGAFQVQVAREAGASRRQRSRRRPLVKGRQGRSSVRRVGPFVVSRGPPLLASPRSSPLQ